MNKIKVLLVDDHTILRKGLKALLNRVKDIEIVEEAADGREAVDRLGVFNPDVVVMDLSLPKLNGVEATRTIKSRRPETKVVILTVHEDEEYVTQALSAGAEAFLVKRSAPNELEAAIRAVQKGYAYLSPQITSKVVHGYLRLMEGDERGDLYSSLSGREREVLQLIAEGQSMREIAELMVISEKTVRSHKASIMAKMRFETTADIILYAVRRGIVDVENK